jgi:glycosyltransferase involved in cell wall biosynthesis
MKVALIDASLFTWPYDRELAGAMSDLGQAVRLFGKALPADDSRRDDPLFEPLFYRSLQAGPQSHLPPAATRIWKGLSHVASMRRLKRTLAVWRPDIIHFQWLPLPVVDARFLKPLRRIAPLVLTVHDSLPFNGTPGSILQNLGAVDIWRTFDRLIVHTKQGEARLLEQGIPAARIARIPHGLLHSGDHAEAPRSTSQVPSPAKPVELLLFGMIKPYKGVDVLIQAIARLPEAIRQQCRVRVVGKPHMDTAPLVNLAQKLGVADSVQFDFRFVPDSELALLMAQADALLFPYREIEASGVLMATIAHGRPLIASRLGAFAELIQHGDNGLLVEPDNDEALAAAIQRFILDPELRKTTSAGMIRLRDSIPGWDDIAGRTLAVYKTLGGSRNQTWASAVVAGVA